MADEKGTRKHPAGWPCLQGRRTRICWRLQDTQHKRNYRRSGKDIEGRYVGGHFPWRQPVLGRKDDSFQTRSIYACRRIQAPCGADHDRRLFQGNGTRHLQRNAYDNQRYDTWTHIPRRTRIQHPHTYGPMPRSHKLRTAGKRQRPAIICLFDRFVLILQPQPQQWRLRLQSGVPKSVTYDGQDRLRSYPSHLTRIMPIQGERIIFPFPGTSRLTSAKQESHKYENFWKWDAQENDTPQSFR